MSPIRAAVPSSPARGSGHTASAAVVRVIDGDTVVARGGDGQDLGRVQILGMDAPELAHEGEPAMCGVADAKKELARLLTSHDITLVIDRDQPDRDKYGRLLRYVEVDGTDGDRVAHPQRARPQLQPRRIARTPRDLRLGRG